MCSYVGNQPSFNMVIGTCDLSYRALVYYQQLANIEDFTFPMKGSSSGVPLGSYRKECKADFCLVFVSVVCVLVFQPYSYPEFDPGHKSAFPLSLPACV